MTMPVDGIQVLEMDNLVSGRRDVPGKIRIVPWTVGASGTT